MLRQLHPDLYVAEMPFSLAGFELGARCTIVRLTDGGLWVHSPIELTPELRQEVDALGAVRYLVAPNTMHYLDLPLWVHTYPEATVYGVKGLKPPPGVNAVKTLSNEPEPEWRAVLEQTLFEGSVLTTEAVFCHRPSRTLILTDTAFNIPRRSRGWTRILARLLGVLGKLGPSRTFKLSLRDRATARRSLVTFLGWDFERVIVSQGEIYEGDGKAALRRAYAFLLQ